MAKKAKRKARSSGTQPHQNHPEVVVVNIPIKDIKVNAHNARKRLDVESIGELADSIRAHGILQPVMVEEAKKGKGYVLVFGHRRVTAAQACGLRDVPAIVAKGDGNFLAALAENVDRVNLDVFEEADAVKTAMTQQNLTRKQIAETTGRSERWVALRQAIDMNVATCWRQVFANPQSPVSRWTASHFGVLAAIPAEIQQEIFDHLGFGDPHPTYDENYSPRELQRIIANECQLLKHAPWKFDDEILVPDAGSCAKCKKRTGAIELLWDTEDDNSPQVNPSKDDRCLDTVCYKSKLAACMSNKAEAARKKYDNLVVARGPSSQPDPVVEEAVGKTVQMPWDAAPCKKSDKGAVPVLQTSGPSAGRVSWMSGFSASKQNKAKAANRAADREAPASKSEKKGLTPAEQQKRLERRRMAHVLKSLRQTLLDWGSPSSSKKRKFSTATGIMLENVVAYVIKFGYHGRDTYGCAKLADAKKVWAEAEKLSDRAAIELIEQLVHGIIPHWADRLNYSTLDDVEGRYYEAEQIAGVFGLDWGQLEDQATMAIPKPKALQKAK